MLVPHNWPCCWVLASPRCSDGGGVECRKGSHRHVSHRLSEEERQRILHTTTSRNSLRCPPDKWCRSLWTGACSLAQSAASTGCCTPMAKQIALASPESGVKLGHHLPAIKSAWRVALSLSGDRRWSRKVVAWDVAEREDPAIAADLVRRAFLRERISKWRQIPLTMHADKGNA